MPISTIKRVFIDSNVSNIIAKAKEKNHEIIYYIKKVLYNIITFGLKTSIEIYRDERRKYEIINVISNIIKNININNNNQDTIIHTNLKYGYVIKQINQRLYLYNGTFSKITRQLYPNQKPECLLTNDVNGLIKQIKNDVIMNFKDYQEYDFSVKIFQEHILYENMNIIDILNNLDQILFAEQLKSIEITADEKIQKLENFIRKNTKFKDSLLKINLQDIATYEAIQNKLKVRDASHYNLISLHAMLNFILNKGLPHLKK
jgi:hypothetical protein